MRAWKKKNPERAKRLKAESKRRHFAKAKAAHTRWVKANPDRVRAAAAKSGKKHRAKISAQGRAWRKANPIRAAAIQARRRARLANAPGNATAEEVEALFASYSGLCVYCLTEADTLDHVVPLSGGGSNGIANLVPACGSCNASKQATPLLVWMARRAA
jgi:5-methylcytosine-specific restriction endonuclease McrA